MASISSPVCFSFNPSPMRSAAVLLQALARFRQASVPGSGGDPVGISSSASTSASGAGDTALAGSPALQVRVTADAFS